MIQTFIYLSHGLSLFQSRVEKLKINIKEIFTKKNYKNPKDKKTSAMD